MTQPKPVAITVEADFDRDGTYETDLTQYCNLRSTGLVIERGMDRLGEYRISELTLQLDNFTGIFSPLNRAGALHGQLGPHVPMRVTAEHDSNSYTLWTGYTQEWRNRYGLSPAQVATVRCQDIATYLVESDPVNVTVATDRNTDEALVAIMAALGLGSGDRDFETGVQDLPIHFVVGAPAIQAMADVVASEMGGRLYVQADGKLRFEARDTRLGITTDADWGDNTNVQCESPQVLLDPRDVVTTVRARTTVFRSGQADTLIFEFSQNMFTRPNATSIQLAAGEIWTRTFQGNSAYVALTTPEPVVDYLANDAQDGTGTDRTSALSVAVTDHGGGRFTIRLRNTHSGAIYVTKFQLRGQPVEFFADRAEAEFSLSVPGMKAGRALEFDIPFAGDTGQKARDYAYQVLRTWRYEVPVLTASFPWDHDETLEAMLSVELGWLVWFEDAAPDGNAVWATGAADWYYVESIRHEIPPTGMKHTVLTLLPSYVYRNLDAIVFDTFDRADASGDLGTSFSGATWANDSGMDIASNAAVANADALQMPNVDLGTSITDQVVEVQIGDIATGDEVGVVLRYEDADNQYRVYLDEASDELILEKNVEGSVSELSSPAFTVGEAHELRAMVQGERIRVWVDRLLLIDEEDDDLTTGTKAGLFARNADATAAFTNFYAQGLN